MTLAEGTRPFLASGSKRSKRNKLSRDRPAGCRSDSLGIDYHELNLMTELLDHRTVHTVHAQSISEWITTQKLKDIYLSSQGLTVLNETKLTPTGFELEDWLELEAKGGVRSIQFDSRSGLLEYPWGWVSVGFYNKNLGLTVHGQRKDVDAWLDSLDKYGFRDEGSDIHWLYGETWSKVSRTTVPLEPIKPIYSAYPWIKIPIEEYTKNYFDNSASILILIGPPGTGKTSFLKQLITASGGDATVTYDTNLLNEDGIFANFINDDDSNLMIFEDADAYLGSRKEGNTMMHRFLNVSDGLVSPMKGKKIVFTTNLPSVADIDPALLRSGRCYEVLHFRSLDTLEANKVAQEVYGDAAPKLTATRYTLADITNLDRVEHTQLKRKVGF